MLEAPSYDHLMDSLARAFRSRYETSGDRKVRLVGLLFAPIGSPLVRDQILPRLQDYHYRSGDHIDFFFAGFGLGGKAPGYRPVLDAPDPYWVYSSALFEQFRKDMEAKTRWRYSGGCELLLCNAHYSDKLEKATLDFNSTVVCDLGKMVTDGAIENVETFFERIFRFAESAKGDDPAWGFSDSMGMSGAGSVLVRVILSLLPRELGKDVERLKHFAVKDVSIA